MTGPQTLSLAGANSGRPFYSAAELVGLTGMPSTLRGVQMMASRKNWPHQVRPGRAGEHEFPVSCLPQATQVAITLRAVKAEIAPKRVTAAAEPTVDAETGEILNANQVNDWESLQVRFDRAPQGMKDEAARKNEHCQRAAMLFDQGVVSSQRQAALAVSTSDGVAYASLNRWLSKVWKQPRCYWLILLLDNYAGRAVTADCDPRAWDWYKGYYLTRKAPTHAITYRRLQEIAQAQGWTIPAARTLERRLDADVSQFTQVLLRHGPEAMARLLPPQDRDRSVFAAGEAANGDGLKFDKLWVRFPDGERLNTATAWLWQDIYSGRILAWRTGKTENTDLFRLAVYDLTAQCAPRYLWIDNTRVAANKLMTAGAETRHRFKDKADDGVGLLLQLGMQPHFTNPDMEMSNPGAKPIERAFGIGGIHDAVATHPKFHERGYSKDTAIDYEEFRQVLAEEVARHNAQEKRRSRVCGGVLSFDQAWQQGIAKAAPRRLTDSQRRLLLMAREIVTVDRCRVRVEAGRGPYGKNAYFAEALSEYIGQKVSVHYDPDNLSADAHIYSLDGRYICKADHQPTVAFNDTTAGREHAKFKARVIKAKKQIAADSSRMDALERAALYGTTTPEAPAAAPADARVVEGHFKKVQQPGRDAKRANEQLQDEFTETVLSRLVPAWEKKQANSL